MALNIDFSVSGLTEVGTLISGLKKQFQFAGSQALNDTAFDIRREQIGTINRVFTKPVAFVKKSPRVKKATKTNLVARVFMDERIAFRLVQQVKSGDRVQRAAAYKLRQLGYISSDEFTVYNDDLTNAAGNLTLATWKKIFTALSSSGTGNYFLATINGTKAIWVRRGRGKKKIRPLVFIVRRSPQYQAILPWVEVGQTVMQEKFDGYWDTRLRAALASAR